MRVDGRAGDWRTMDFPLLVSAPDTVPATAKIRSAQGQVTRQFVGNGLGAFGVSKRHATEVRQDPAIDQDIKIEPRHAGSHREMLAAPHGVRATPCCGETAQGAPCRNSRASASPVRLKK